MMNSIKFENGRAIKTYTARGDAITAVHSIAGDFVYSGRLERFRRERDRLLRYNINKLPVPDYLGSNEAKLEVTMQELNGRSFWKCLLDREFSKSQTLRYLEKSAAALKSIHLCGEEGDQLYGQHGDSWLSNFIITPMGVYAIDFEQQNRHGKQGDLSSLYVSALVSIDADEDEIRRAIVYGYGSEPVKSGSLIAKGALAMPWLAKRLIRG